MINLLKIAGDKLTPVGRSSLVSEEALERWIADDPKVLGLDVMVIGRQIMTDFKGRIDILAIDSEGDLVIIELKRDKTPRDIVAQVLDYASWVSILSTKEVHDIALQNLRKPLAECFHAHFDKALPETLNDNHSMLIVASQFDPSSERIVEYLSEVHDIGINTVFFNVFEHNGELLLATDWLLDPQEVVERSEKKKKAPWTGLWYANVGEGMHRSWEDMRKYGFLAAGMGSFYSKRLSQLSVGDKVFAYQKGAGYVGYGIVTSEMAMASQFEVDGKPLFSLSLKEPNLKHDPADPELAEYAVGIDWRKTFPISEAKTFPGRFANQNVVCKLRDQATIDFVRNAFGVVD